MNKNVLKKRQIEFDTIHMPQKRTPYLRYAVYLLILHFLLMFIVFHFGWIKFDLKYLPYVYQ